MRAGACVIAEPLALIRSRPDSYSQTMRDTAQQTEVLNAILDLLAQADFRDIRAFMRDCPSNLSVYDPLILKLMAGRIRDWDMFAAYALWKMRDAAPNLSPRQLPRRLVRKFQKLARLAWHTLQSRVDRS